MKSSSYKYALEKVLELEKKYAKPVPDPHKKKEGSTSFQNIDSISSVSLDVSSGSETKSKSDSALKRNPLQEKNNELTLCRNLQKPVKNVIQVVNGLSDCSLESARVTSYGRKHTEVQKDTYVQKNFAKDRKHKSVHTINSNVTSWSDNCDDNVALIKTEKNNAFPEEHQKNTSTNETEKQFQKFDENVVAQNDTKIITRDKIECAVSGTSESVNESEGHGRGTCVQKYHNNNFDTCNEISDVENNSIDSLPVEDESNINNISLHVLNFQDLNGAEKLKSSLKELDNLSIKSNSDHYSHIIQDYSKETSYLAEENFSYNSENTDTVEKDEVSKILSEMEHSDKCSVQLTKIESEDDSSIKEEIEDEMKVFSSGDLSDEIPIISKNSKDLSELGVNSEVKVTIAVNKKVYDHDFKSDQPHTNIGFQGKSVVNTKRIINKKQDNLLLAGSKLGEILNKTSRKGNHTENAIVHAERENSYNETLTIPKDKHNKIHRRTEKYDTEHTVNDLKRDNEKKRYAVKSLHNSEKIFHRKVHHASAQTENYLLLENDEFERKMESIMKSSFVSVPNTDASQEDFQKNVDNQVFQANIMPASSSLTPLERGFYCSLRQQVELTKHFIQAEYNMYLACVTAIKELSATYKPATLNHTRISQKKKSRKKRTERMETD